MTSAGDDSVAGEYDCMTGTGRGDGATGDYDDGSLKPSDGLS